MATQAHTTSRYRNLSPEMLADEIGRVDAILNAAESELKALKDEFKARGLQSTIGSSYTVTASYTGLPSNILAFPIRAKVSPSQHDAEDPLDRKNLDHAHLAMHVAAQYDEEKINPFLRELITDRGPAAVLDLLRNNARAIRYLKSAFDLMPEADTAIVEAADRILAQAN